MLKNLIISSSLNLTRKIKRESSGQILRYSETFYTNQIRIN